jgi:hypothetical protein
MLIVHLCLKYTTSKNIKQSYLKSIFRLIIMKDSKINNFLIKYILNFTLFFDKGFVVVYFFV